MEGARRGEQGKGKGVCYRERERIKGGKENG